MGNFFAIVLTFDPFFPENAEKNVPNLIKNSKV